METMLEDNGLKEVANNDIQKPATVEVHNLVDSKKCVEKVRMILLEEVWDHIIANIHGKETLYAMLKALIGHFQKSSDQRNMSLKEKIRNIKMHKGDIILQYLSRFTQCRDELSIFGVTIVEDDLVSLTLLGLPKSGHNY